MWLSAYLHFIPACIDMLRNDAHLFCILQASHAVVSMPDACMFWGSLFNYLRPGSQHIWYNMEAGPRVGQIYFQIQFDAFASCLNDDDTRVDLMPSSLLQPASLADPPMNSEDLCLLTGRILEHKCCFQNNPCLSQEYSRLIKSIWRHAWAQASYKSFQEVHVLVGALVRSPFFIGPPWLPPSSSFWW